MQHDFAPIDYTSPAQMLAEAQEEIERLTADRDSWQHQASDRVDDAVQFAAERDALRVALISVAASLAWHSFGECRAYASAGHVGRPISPAKADALAKKVLRIA